MLAFILSACDEVKTYNLLYPIEASKQDVLRLQGYRFLSSSLDSPASILVLSNPVKNGEFADFAFAMTNRSDKALHLSNTDFILKMSKHGKLLFVSSEEYAQAQNYKKPEGFDKLSPKMQAFGCAATSHKDNIEPSSFNPSQRWVWERHLEYPFKKQEIYIKNLDISPGETKGGIFRIKLPEMSENFEQSTILIHLKIPGHNEYRFKFILQSLK